MSGINVALLGTDLESDVKRGENSGCKLRYDFVVLQASQQRHGGQCRFLERISFVSEGGRR